MASEDYKRCPVDGTRFFEATPTYPHGRPKGSRCCSSTCDATARLAKLGRIYTKRTSNFATLDVDGTLGSEKERADGGVDYVNGAAVEHPNHDGDATGARVGHERINLGDGYTAIPKAYGRWL